MFLHTTTYVNHNYKIITNYKNCSMLVIITKGWTIRPQPIHLWGPTHVQWPHRVLQVRFLIDRFLQWARLSRGPRFSSSVQVIGSIPEAPSARPGHSSGEWNDHLPFACHICRSAANLHSRRFPTTLISLERICKWNIGHGWKLQWRK